MGRQREESGTQLKERRLKPYFVYFEGTPGLLTRDYAKFPNKIMWKLAEKVREVVASGRVVRVEDDLGSKLTATYDGRRLYGMQFRAGDPPGRCHFPWGRCGVFNGDENADGEIYLSYVQGVAGMLSEPMRWKVKDSWVVEVDGGGEVGEECRRLFEQVPGSNRLIEIMFGYHPKASIAHGIEDPMHWELISKMPWAGLGTERKHPNFRHVDGSVLNARLYIDDRLVVDKYGMLDRSLLHHPEVLEAASQYGDPYQVLAPVSHEAHGSNTLW
jgi:leucyl aminopeptidase (aminopeptidase T)